MLLLLSLTGDVKSINNLWLIRDQFLNDIFHALPSLHHSAQASKQQIPFVYDFYNVMCYTPNPNSLIKNVLARLANCLIKVLNDSLKMPRIIIVIPDVDILKFIAAKFGLESIKSMISAASSWVINQFQHAIEAKKEGRRKIGAIIGSEPKIVWVKALYGTNSSHTEGKITKFFNAKWRITSQVWKGTSLLALIEQ